VVPIAPTAYILAVPVAAEAEVVVAQESMSPIMSRTLSLAVWVVTWVVLCALESAPADACYACDRDLDPSPMALSRQCEDS